MSEDTMVTCPKHGIQFNRAHYRECELCRGAHISQLTVESPFGPVWTQRLKVGGTGLAFVLGAYIASALIGGGKHTTTKADPAAPIVGLPCAKDCADRAHECFVDCAAVRDDQCTDACMPQLRDCAGKCRPRLQLPEGFAVLSSGLPGPELNESVKKIYQAWPADELPSQAFVRLGINRLTGTVHDVKVQAESELSATRVAATFKQSTFPKDTSLGDGLGRSDTPEPYFVYLVLKP